MQIENETLINNEINSIGFISLSSGSKQNCYLIHAGNIKILIDFGLSVRQATLFLTENKTSFEEIRAIFVTHEHEDHVRGLENLSKKHSEIPIYINHRSRNRLLFDVPKAYDLEHLQPVTIGELNIVPFNVKHDAVNTFGFKIRYRDKSLFFASDIGSFDQTAMEHCKDSDLIAIEANYDAQMLRSSYYPAHLKRRIDSEFGHLSNTQSMAFLQSCISKKTKFVCFLHLSENNNSKDAVQEMIKRNLKTKHEKISFQIAERECPIPPIWL